MERDNVRHAEEFIELRRASAGGDYGLRCNVGIIDEVLDIKPGKSPCNATADASPAKDADRLARQILADSAAPGAFPHNAVSLRYTAQARQHQGNSQIGDRGIIASRRIRHGNALGRRGIEIDVIYTNPVHG